MFRKAFIVIVVLALTFGVTGSASAAGAESITGNAEKCTAEQGQLFIYEGRYKDAIREFSCLIDAQPTEVEGYRGRIEAQLLLGRYSDAVRDYARVTAYVQPVHPDAESIIMAGYEARLSANPDDVPALTGVSFAHWWFFEYATAIQVLNHLLDVRPNDLYGNLFRGSSRLLRHATPAQGEADLERAISLAPQSADVRYVVADAYFYGRADYTRALEEATLALDWGLDTPRIHAILAGVYLGLGDMPAAAAEIQRHIELVTTELVPSAPLPAGTSLSLPLVPGRTYDIPVPATAGETLAISTGSHDFYDTIIVLFAPDGTPVVGSDDYKQYFAGFQWTAEVTGTYHLWATSFEGVDTGDMVATRK